MLRNHLIVPAERNSMDTYPLESLINRQRTKFNKELFDGYHITRDKLDVIEQEKYHEEIK